MSLTDLFKPKWKHSNPFKRIIAVEKIEDQEILKIIINNDSNFDVRIAAVNKLEDQEILKNIAVTHDDSRVRLIAIKKISDKNFLLETAKNNKDYFIRCYALSTIDDENTLIELYKKDKTFQVRLEIIQRISDENVLFEIFQKDKILQIRLAIVQKINNKHILLKIAMDDPDAEVRKIAITRIKDDDLLFQILKIEKGSLIRLLIVEKIKNQEMLFEIAKNDKVDKLRLAAIKNLEDPHRLRELSKKERNNKYFCRVILDKLLDKNSQIFGSDSERYFLYFHNLELSRLSDSIEKYSSLLITNANCQSPNFITASKGFEVFERKNFKIEVENEIDSVAQSLNLKDEWFYQALEKVTSLISSGDYSGLKAIRESITHMSEKMGMKKPVFYEFPDSDIEKLDVQQIRSKIIALSVNNNLLKDVYITQKLIFAFNLKSNIDDIKSLLREIDKKGDPLNIYIFQLLYNEIVAFGKFRKHVLKHCDNEYSEKIDIGKNKTDTQLDLENYTPANFPEIIDEIVCFQLKEYALSEWLKTFRGQDIFSWTLPEIDYGEPRESNEWTHFRNPNSRKQIEEDYLALYVRYAQIIFSYIKNKKLSLDRNQYTTAILQVVWIILAKKYKMLRREFYSLSNAMNLKVKRALKKIKNDNKIIVHNSEADINAQEDSNENIQDETTSQDFALLNAVKKNQLDIVNELLSNGMDVNTSDKDKTSILSHASQAGYVEIVKTLLDNGADVNAINNFGDSVFISACWGGNSEIVKILLGHGADSKNEDKYGHTGLEIATMRGFSEVKKLIVDNRKEAGTMERDDSVVLINATRFGQKELVKTLLYGGLEVDTADNNGYTLLMIAAREGHLELVKLLLEKGAEINRNSPHQGTALIIASTEGHAEIARLLLDKGADINFVNKYIGSALMRASEKGHIEIVKELINRGANLNLKFQNNITALIYASREEHSEIVKLLINKGANVNVEDIVNKGNYTPLMYAAAWGHTENVKILLNKGSNVNAKTLLNHTTALILASLNGHIEIVKMLLNHNADITIRDKRGFDAMEAASRAGHRDVVELLKNFNKNPTMPTNQKASIIRNTKRLEENKKTIKSTTKSDLARKQAIKAWKTNETMWDGNVRCDICQGIIKKNEGYLIKPSVHSKPIKQMININDIVCDNCFDENQHEAWEGPLPWENF